VKKIGLIGFGRIGSYLYDKISDNKDLAVDFVYETIKEKTAGLDSSIVVQDMEMVLNREADLVVEAADFRVVKDYAPHILKKTDLMVLSVTALADAKLESNLYSICKKNGTRIGIPHGALLGMDGIFDARESLTDVQVITTKNPRNIDFSFTDKYEADDIKEVTVLYDGPTRGICSMFPRNVNAHAVVALSGLGFDRTRSKLITDPHSDDALQHVIAEGGGTLLEIKRSSAIKGVTGEYTLVSLYGSIIRALSSPPGISVL
jgi:aspartate dehydrogenase